MTNTPTPPPTITPQPTITPAPTGIWATPTPLVIDENSISGQFLQDMTNLDFTVQMDDFTVNAVQMYNVNRDFMDVVVWAFIAFMVATMFFTVMRRIRNL